MKTARLLGLLGLIGAIGAQAQLRSVTRRTIQTPLGIPTLLQPQTGNLSPAIGTAPAAPTPTALVQIRPRLKDRTDAGERARARREFEIQCAERGLPSFQFSLAGRYLTGNGVPRDPEKALKLLQSAAAKGHDKSKRALEEFDRLVARGESADDAVPPEDAGDAASRPAPPRNHELPRAIGDRTEAAGPFEELEGRETEAEDADSHRTDSGEDPKAVAGKPPLRPMPSAAGLPPE